ncbi:MAG TPA: transcriptional repressor, partial [Spirochaetes bacterium]|nr:transcriptional repressor [Spirochaetota bacterium]
MDSLQVKSFLESKDIKVTVKRLAVIECILRIKGLFSAIDLHNQLSDRLDVDLVTVYRFLTVLKEKGIVRDVLSDESVQYFEMTSMDNPAHPHFKCYQCHKLLCLKPLTFDDSLFFIQSAGDLHIDHVSVVLSGLC